MPLAAGVEQVWDELQKIKNDPDWRKKKEATGYFSPETLENYARYAEMSEDEYKTEIQKVLRITPKSREQPDSWSNGELNNPSQPVVGITWFEAVAYCAWLSETTHGNYRLATEIEWEAAARGSRGLIFPWGNRLDPARANSAQSRIWRPSPIGAFAASGGNGPFRTEDQAGNVWEWTSSLYRDYPYDPTQSELPDSTEKRVMRGGSWDYNRDFCRSTFRRYYIADNYDNDIGFRVLSPDV